MKFLTLEKTIHLKNKTLDLAILLVSGGIVIPTIFVVANIFKIKFFLANDILINSTYYSMIVPNAILFFVYILIVFQLSYHFKNILIKFLLKKYMF